MLKYIFLKSIFGVSHGRVQVETQIPYCVRVDILWPKFNHKIGSLCGLYHRKFDSIFLTRKKLVEFRKILISATI